MISKQKETDLVNEYRGKHAVDGLLQARRGNKKYSNYVIYILDNDATVFVNLDNGTGHLSEEPNKKAIKAFRAKEERKLARQQKKADREQEKAERAAKPKAEPKAKAERAPKPKLKKAPVTGQAGWSNEEWARIQAIMAEKKCTRKNAIRAFQNERAVKEADAKVTPAAEQKKVHDPLAQATTVQS